MVFAVSLNSEQVAFELIIEGFFRTSLSAYPKERLSISMRSYLGPKEVDNGNWGDRFFEIKTEIVKEDF